jgi:hypothetical protein
MYVHIRRARARVCVCVCVCVYAGVECDVSTCDASVLGAQLPGADTRYCQLPVFAHLPEPRAQQVC